MDRDFGDGRQGVEVDLLPGGRLRIETTRDAGSVVPDGDDLIGGLENVPSEGFDIQPFQSRALLQQPKIQVKPVYVDNCAHETAWYKKQRLRRIAPSQPLCLQHAAGG